ncbi:MAG: flagellar basal body rod protein FlgB [Colwellia sp.]
MAINFDKTFELHAKSLNVRAQRAEIIAANIANADTPGYKAKGLDFQKVMAQAKVEQSHGMVATHDKHFNIGLQNNAGVAYRVPEQPDTGDGNSVDVQKERNMYLQNSMAYQASLQFLTGRIKSMKNVITGGK